MGMAVARVEKHAVTLAVVLSLLAGHSHLTGARMEDGVAGANRNRTSSLFKINPNRNGTLSLFDFNRKVSGSLFPCHGEQPPWDCNTTQFCSELRSTEAQGCFASHYCCVKCLTKLSALLQTDCLQNPGANPFLRRTLAEIKNGVDSWHQKCSPPTPSKYCHLPQGDI